MRDQVEIGQGLRIGEIAEVVGLSPETIRYYERAELLPPPARTRAGYRSYGDEAVERLYFIQGAQRLGLKLDDIRNLLSIRDTGACPCEPAGELLEQRLTELDAQIRRLEALRTELVTMVEALPAEDCPLPTPGTWREREREHTNGTHHLND